MKGVVHDVFDKRFILIMRWLARDFVLPRSSLPVDLSVVIFHLCLYFSVSSMLAVADGSASLHALIVVVHVWDCSLVQVQGGGRGAPACSQWQSRGTGALG